MQAIRQNWWRQLENPHSGSHRLTLGLILLCGFLLRFYSLYIGQAYHYSALNDEVTALSYALKFLAGDPRAYYLGQPFFAGAQIPGPLWTLFVAASYILGGNSVEGAIFIMLLVNTLVIYLVYRLASHFLTPQYALFTALIYAVSAWPVFYSAGLWNPLPLALLGALLYLALWRVSNSENSPAIFWVCLLSASLPQFHMIGVFYYPAIILLLFLAPTRINRQWLMLGIFAGLLLYLPYLIGDALHGWENLRKLGSEHAKFSFSVLKILTIPITVLSNHPGNWAGDGFGEFKEFGNAWFGSYLVLILLNVVSLVLSAFFFINPIKRFLTRGAQEKFSLKQRYASEPQLGFLVILLVLPMLVFLITGKNYSTRYTLLMLPLLFLLPGLFISRLTYSRYQHLVIGLFSAMLATSVYLILAFYQYLGHKIETTDQFMPSFRQLAKLDNVISNDAGIAAITIDASHYIKDEGEQTYITGNGIKDYIEAMAAYRNREKKTELQVNYLLLPINVPAPASAKPVYADKGIRLYRTEGH